MTSPITYTLRNRQQTALHRDRTSIRVALPVPLTPLEPDTATDWACSVLSPADAALVTSAVLRSVWVDPLYGRTSDEAIMMAALGQIVDPVQLTRTAYLVSVNVVVVTLTPARCRTHKRRIQWPAECMFLGEPWPPGID